MKFKNRCGHLAEEYVGTISDVEKVNGEWMERFYDVYVFADKHFGHEVCIRYGNEPSEYLSPGTIDMMVRSTREIYRKTMSLIEEQGFFVYKRRKCVS